MARTNRRDVVAVGEVQVFYCVNRYVRRAYLCGRDPVSGKDFEVRREWIRGPLEFLAGVMTPAASVQLAVFSVRRTQQKKPPHPACRPP